LRGSNSHISSNHNLLLLGKGVLRAVTRIRRVVVTNTMKKMGKNRMGQTMLPITMRARVMIMGVGIVTANLHIK
jgi:hypothetical protein